jgi:nucleotide-binding universal stress UspA family protein
MVCLDGSELGEQILPYAIEQASRFDSNIVLFRAFTESSLTSIGIPGFPAVPLETLRGPKQTQKEESESISYLKVVADRIQNERAQKIECVTMFGVPGQAIVQYANDSGVDLITIATHGRSGLGRAIIGSVADYVVRQSGIPILLIRPIKIEKGKTARIVDNSNMNA